MKCYKYKITVNARNIARFEFESWCQGVTSEFPEYSVKLDGVGFPASGQTSQGPCSQVHCRGMFWRWGVGDCLEGIDEQ